MAVQHQVVFLKSNRLRESFARKFFASMRRRLKASNVGV
jgi:hypothetical protein